MSAEQQRKKPQSWIFHLESLADYGIELPGLELNSKKEQHIPDSSCPGLKPLNYLHTVLAGVMIQPGCCEMLRDSEVTMKYWKAKEERNLSTEILHVWAVTEPQLTYAKISVLSGRDSASKKKLGPILDLSEETGIPFEWAVSLFQKVCWNQSDRDCNAQPVGSGAWLHPRKKRRMRRNQKALSIKLSSEHTERSQQSRIEKVLRNSLWDIGRVEGKLGWNIQDFRPT